MTSGFFSPKSNFKDRYIKDFNRLKKVVDNCRGLGMRVVLTQGTYDMIHIGHARYFEEAKKHGDFLIVGVDSDAKVRKRKGPGRPVVPEEERLEMLTHLRPIDAVFLKEDTHLKWKLIKVVRPDVLIATKETYTKDQLKELKKVCGEVVVLNPMATTSTSAKIRLLHVNVAQKIEEELVPRIVDVVKETFSNIKKGGK